MLEWILSFEKDLFFVINGSHTYFTDCVMWLFSGSIIWVPIIIFLIFSLVYKKKWEEWLPLLIAIILLFVFCDQFSSNLIKPLFARSRPTHYPGIMEHVRTLYGYVGGQYGFISGHATNAFGFVSFTALIFRNRVYSVSIFIWALIMAYSRVYLGVHFISDVVFGAISGILIGYMIFKLYAITMKKISQIKGTNLLAAYSGHQATIISVIFLSYIILFSFFSEYLITYLSHTKVW